MVDYPFKSMPVADPHSFARAANAEVTIYAATDTANATPLAIKDPSGIPLPNPMTTTPLAYLQAFLAPVPDIKFVGGGLEVFESSPEGLRNAAQAAADNAAEAARAELEARIAAGEFKGADGAPGADGSNVLPTDTAIRDAINNSASATRGALDAAYATKTELDNLPAGSGSLGARTVYLGDSITQGSAVWNSAGQFQESKAHEWPTYATILSQGRINMAKNAGVGGNTSAQMLARFDADVTPLAPETVVLTSGTNDLGQGRTMTAWLDDTKAIVAKIRAIGATPVLGAIYPMNTSALTATAATWNRALRDWATTEGIPVIGFDQVTDAATGLFPSTWITDADKTHPSLGDGHGTLGRKFIEDLSPLFGAPRVALPPFNSYGVFTNGFFTTHSATAPGNQPTPVGATAAAGGSLPEGIYQYAAAGKAGLGYTVASTPVSVTVAAGQKVTFQFNGDYGTYAIYRKRGDAPWVMLTEANAGTVPRTFEDLGSLTPVRTEDPPTVDGSRLPADWQSEANNHLAYRATVPGVRGYVLRQSANNLGVLAKTAYPACVPGEVWEIVGKVRKDLGVTATLTAQVQDAGGANVVRVRPLNSLLSSLGWGVFSTRFTIPANGARIKVSMEVAGDTTSSKFVDWAELDLRKIS